MTRDEAFQAWAPRGARWAPWVKPVLFAHLDAEAHAAIEAAPSPWLRHVLGEPPVPGPPHRTNARVVDTALVVDLPGFDSLSAGLALLDEGFFPVPVFNAIPHPEGVVDLAPIVALLASTVADRVAAALASDAPPAFLLDARREKPPRSSASARFDNRSFVSGTDFPSASALLEHGLDRIIVVHDGSLASDLRAVLVEMQRGGLRIFTKAITDDEPPRAKVLRGPGLVARFVDWFARSQFRRTEAGPFGGPPQGS